MLFFNMPVSTFSISKTYDETFSVNVNSGNIDINDTNIKSVISLDKPLQGIYKIIKYSDICSNENTLRYAEKYFRYDNGCGFSEYITIKNISDYTFDPEKDLIIEFCYIYTKTGKTTGTISINGISFSGEYALSIFDSEAFIENYNEQALLTTSDILKIFKITDFEVISTHKNYQILYRFTQNDGRTYSKFEELTKANITTAKIDKMRFVKFEYLITNLGEPLMVYDIILEGEIQNVSKNYLKLNKYGLKEDCLRYASTNSDMDIYTKGMTCYGDVVGNLNNQNASNTKLYNPYDLNNIDKIVQFSALLGNSASQLISHEAEYHITDPDGNGIDKYLHEYTLKNIVNVKRIKVIVPDNKFPTDSIMTNFMNLNFLDNFTVQIMKDEFKNAFGVSKRPSKDDVIYFCIMNLIFTVSHAQAKREIMNASTYYTLTLTKYEGDTSIKSALSDSIDQLQLITLNTTNNDLFGDAIKSENDKVTKKQYKTENRENIRDYTAKEVKITKGDYNVSNFEIIKYYYDLSDRRLNNSDAIIYKESDNKLEVSDNRNIMFFVKFHNSYSPDTRVNQAIIDNYEIRQGYDFILLDNYDYSLKKGYEIKYRSGKLFFKINNRTYSQKIDLMSNVWYGISVNIDQRQKTIGFDIFRRNSTIDIYMYNLNDHSSDYIDSNEIDVINDMISDGFQKVDNVENIGGDDLVNINSSKFEFVNEEFDSLTLRMKLKGNLLNFANLRIFDEIIEDDNISNVMKHYIVADSQHLLLYDNCPKKSIAKSNLPTNNFVN